MKTTYAFVDPDGNKVFPESYSHHTVLATSIRFLPNIGDPEDPNDVDELEITYTIDDGVVL